MTDTQTEDHAERRHSHVYLLRLWREADETPWRMSLREASTGAPIGLADLDDLVIFLLRVMEQQAEIADETSRAKDE